jgi:hypothetical protein
MAINARFFTFLPLFSASPWTCEPHHQLDRSKSPIAVSIRQTFMLFLLARVLGNYFERLVDDGYGSFRHAT